MKARRNLRHASWALLAALLGMVCLAGCATPRQEYSDQPWNQPQPWEGVLPIPGMDGRY